jgi:outer membrane protein assembly factor BamA
VIERVRGADAPPGVNYGEASLAYVGDYSYFAFTSPVVGGRYRFEVTPIFGGLNMQTLLGDYRRYFLARPLTFAFRGLYFGRYGKDAENTRLSPLFLGEETLIRGYAFESFDPEECSAVAGDGAACPEFDRLVGSRVGVFNAELRIPLFGTPEYGVFTTRFLPIEIAPFLDMGVSWRKDETTKLRFSRNTLDRVPVFSTGVAVRANLFGFAVLETYYAYPFQRAEKGWHFGFSLAPGW